MFGLFINWDDVWNNIRAMIIWVCMQFMQIAKSILNLIFDLANITFFKDETIGELLTRVYIVVGVLMLFKITISCIQYLVNPDKVDDKENGFGGIAKRTIISVLLLALVPGIFQFAKEAQGGILEAIPAVILGQESLIDIDDMGGSITYTTTLSFFGYTSDSCNDGSIQGHKGGGTSSKFKSIDDIINNTKEITSATCNGGKRYDFNILLCLAMGIFLVFILISMVIDIGIRVVKFGFLELIAPIPIASYIDPKTSKKSFDSWVQNSVSVYADLFIRIGVIYLILYLFITLLPSFQSNFTLNDGTTLSTPRSLLVNVAIIVSLFFFAKNAPKFICDVLGIKDNGNLTDMFKRASGLAGAGLAGLRTARSNYTAQKERWQGKGKGAMESKLRAALSAAAGAGSATGRGLKQAVYDKKGFNDVRKGASKAAIATRDSRADRVDNLYKKGEYGWSDYRRDKRRAELGIPSGSAFLEARNKEASEIRASSDSQINHGLKKLEDVKSMPFTSLDPVKGFGTVTDGDGNAVTINTTTLAYARKMASLNVGDYYDDGKVAQRQAERIKINDKVVDLKTEFERLSNLKASGGSVSDADLNKAKADYEKAQFNFKSYEERFFKDGQNGQAVATVNTAAEWDTLVHSFEKQARFQNEANLIKSGDVDAVSQLEKTISKLNANKNLGLGNSETDKQIKELIKDKFGVDDIEGVIRILDARDSNGKRDVDATALEKFKMLSEGLVKITNQEALEAAERTKRTQQAIQNDKKGGN